MKKLLLGVLIIASAFSYTNAQTTTTEASKWSFALRGGVDYFRVTPVRDWQKDFDLGLGLTVERTVNPIFGWGIDVDYLKFKNGADVVGATLDPSLFMSVNLSNLLLPHRASANFNAYAKVGAGAGLQLSALGDKIVDTYNTSYVANPLFFTSIGIEQNLNRLLAIGLEAKYRGYMDEQVGGMPSKDRQDDALSLMASLRFKLGSLANHTRSMTMDQMYPAPAPVIKQVENPYDDSALKSGLADVNKKIGALDGRVGALEQALKELATAEEGTSKAVSFQNIEFEFDSSKLTAPSKGTLDEIATILKDNPTWGSLIIKGNTDNVGPDAYNQKLSEKRAQAVKDYLVSKGISASALSAVGYGETKPIASNDTAEGRQENRRVDFEVVK